MKIVGTRYIKARKDFGNVENAKELKFDHKAAEAVMMAWIQKGTQNVA